MMRKVRTVGLMVLPLACVLGMVGCAGSKQSFSQKASAPQLWIDPAWQTGDTLTGGLAPRVVIWFDQQYLEGGAAYATRTGALQDAKRLKLRKEVVAELRKIHARSWQSARPVVERLQAAGVLANCRHYWIVNSVTCDKPPGHMEEVRSIPGAARVFYAAPNFIPPPSAIPVTIVSEASSGQVKPNPDHATWNIKRLGAERVWREFGLTGRGVLQVVHDFGFTLRQAPIRSTLWRNPREQANGADDDGNGLIDDVHGFNFDNGSNEVGLAGAPGLPGGASHGDLTAALLAGGELADTAAVLGVAPGSRWSPVIATNNIEAGVQWAIEHNADTYSMSFSIPGLGELRAHWRKAMEHGALAGLFLVSGAGNFADSTRPNYVAIPEQMRIPEDVPLAVMGVSGVGQDGKRPLFSSQGPVRWQTSAYNEGLVQKPDFATINTNVLGFDSVGHSFVPGPRGWSGNSFAGPHTAGVLALMIEADPNLTPWRARDILIRTAQDVEPAGVDMQTGAGVLDAYAAVREVLRTRRK